MIIVNQFKIGQKGKTEEERFLEKINKKSINECWEWEGHRNKRYGYFKLHSGQNIHAHRYSYFLETGYFPKTMEYICHHCDNGFCVNPKHLFLGTQFDNMRDMVNKGRKSNCLGEKNPNVKLTEKEVQNIINLHNKGISYSKLSKIFGIGNTQIGRILHKKSWSWLT